MFTVRATMAVGPARPVTIDSAGFRSRVARATSGYVDIVQSMAEDPYGVGLVGTYQAKSLPSACKAVYRSPRRKRRVYSTAGYNDVLPATILFAVLSPLRQRSGKTSTALVKEYARLILSREGQVIIASQRNSAQSYLPLTVQESRLSLSRLE